MLWVGNTYRQAKNELEIAARCPVSTLHIDQLEPLVSDRRAQLIC
jgi:hypothetical protein